MFGFHTDEYDLTSETELQELYKALGVDNQKHALQAINGLKERVKFTENYDTLLHKLAVNDRT